MARHRAYLAVLGPGDYDRFRERDPLLPALYSTWLDQLNAHMRVLRRRGSSVGTHRIHFEAFVERNSILGIEAFDATARNSYATEQAAAEAVSRRP